ncbi:hypothetical protein AAF712_011607 [Marasmius tenuissimus]|uniref:F-type H+-transporting ATPase subunit H n=1 Tax=Marasmius tenuissimus TaxID=585030 RepID=A0ABR2ZK12_9AGAR
MPSAMFRRAASSASRSRFFSSSAAARKDLVQDLYLREIKAYKPAPVAKDAHVGLVKQYSAPAAPKAPSLSADLSSDLSTYKTSEPALADAPAPSNAAAADGEGNVSGADAYLSFLEQDLPKREEHHH